MGITFDGINLDCDTCFGQGYLKLWPYAKIDFKNPQKPIYVRCPECNSKKPKGNGDNNGGCIERKV